MSELRPAAADDLVAVAALDAVLFPDEPWDLAAWQGLVATGGRRLLVAVVEDTVVGSALTGVVGDFAELLRIGLHPAHRRQGIARQLLARACDAVAEDGAERLLLEVGEANTAARAFYAATGFVEIDRRPGYYRDGSAALVLELAMRGSLDAPERMDP